MADQQVALERLRELYREKNEHLEKFLEPVEPYEFYREIFPEGSFERKGHFEAVSYTHLTLPTIYSV
mgnify:CR=1 FL=1